MNRIFLFCSFSFFHTRGFEARSSNKYSNNIRHWVFLFCMCRSGWDLQWFQCFWSVRFCSAVEFIVFVRIIYFFVWLIKRMKDLSKHKALKANLNKTQDTPLADEEIIAAAVVDVNAQHEHKKDIGPLKEQKPDILFHVNVPNPSRQSHIWYLTKSSLQKQWKCFKLVPGSFPALPGDLSSSTSDSRRFVNSPRSHWELLWHLRPRCIILSEA